MRHWQTTRFNIDLSQPKVMGIVNVTPDSFSDGGSHNDPAHALKHCEWLLREGVDILDLGGESTRPGAPSLTVEEEWQRLAEIIPQALRFGVPVSIDTCKTEVMRRALDLGVDIINDVRGLEDEGAIDLVAAHGQCGLCVMHMQGSPETMQLRPTYPDVVDEVRAYLSSRVDALSKVGVAPERITLDPGIGFGKTLEHNFRLLREQANLLTLGFPLLVGWSRKSSLGALTGRDVADRVPASVAAALAGVQRGASIVRVHDVGPMVDALKVWEAAGLLGPKS